MSEFDKHWNEWAIASNCTEDEAKIHFEAGQQSQQAKIDELQARIDCLKGSVDWYIEDCELALSMNKNNAWSGGQLEILRAIKKRLEDMLKGNKDENRKRAV